MLARVYSATMVGLTPTLIEIEVSSKSGVPQLLLIGLATKSVTEAKERITSALHACGVRVRSKRTIVNLAPADLKKTGSAFELAIAVGMLKLYGIGTEPTDTLFFGELSLDGTLKPIRGALPLTLAAKKLGFSRVVLPAANSNEVRSVAGITINPIASLAEYIAFCESASPLPCLQYEPPPSGTTIPPNPDFKDIVGQLLAKRALTIAAAGGHHTLLVGPPGVGKSMLAQALSGILPPLSAQESIEVSTIYSLSGNSLDQLITKRPFRSPHHTITQLGLIGGGSNLSPGEITLAHRGILFLDEFTEFKRNTIEALRQPLESHQITIARSSGAITYPAQFSLIIATNSCPCGYSGSSKKICTCTLYDKQRYQQKLSGPLLDRIDLQVRVKEVSSSELSQRASTRCHTSKEVRAQVARARKKQRQRFAHTQLSYNAELTSKLISSLCLLTPSAQQLLNAASNKMDLSTRAYFKTIKVAQTIADLENESTITADHIAEALQFRIQYLANKL